MTLFDNFVYKNGEIVDIGFVKWVHWGVSDEEGEEREEHREDWARMGHCKPCTALSGCYFVKSNLPKKKAEGDGLLHPHCDCQLENIAKPTVKAYCAVGKFSGYVFSDKYKINGKKVLFESLGYTIDDSEFLKTEYETQAKQKYLNGDYEIGKLDEHGQRIKITIMVDSSTRKNIKFISGWMVHPLGLITCTTPLAD